MSQFLGLSNDDVKTIGAGATTVGVLLALFGPPLRGWWRSPLLSLEYEARRGDPHWDHVSVEGGDVFFLRLRVRNARGCVAARDTQVLVSSYRAADLGLEGRALEWSGQRARHDLPVTKLSVAPGMERHIDLVQIDRKALAPESNRPSPPSQKQPQAAAPVASEAAGPPLLARLCVLPKPWGDAHLVPKGDHDVVVTITAANSDPISYSFVISYEGEAAARLLAAPKRLHRRRIATLLRTGAKRAVGAYGRWP